MAREQNVNISIVDLIINLPFPRGAEEVSVPVQQNPGPLGAVGGECRAGWRAGELEGAGEPLQHGWGGQGLEPAWLGCRCLTVVWRDVLSKCAMASSGSAG